MSLFGYVVQNLVYLINALWFHQLQVFSKLIRQQIYHVYKCFFDNESIFPSIRLSSPQVEFMLFECLQDVLGGRTGFFLAVSPSILINMIWRLCDWCLHADDFSYDSKISNQVNSYLVDVTSENTRTARLYNEIEITHVKSKTCPSPLKKIHWWKCINN